MHEKILVQTFNTPVTRQVFTTTDGKQFRHVKDANIHQAYLDDLVVVKTLPKFANHYLVKSDTEFWAVWGVYGNGATYFDSIDDYFERSWPKWIQIHSVETSPDRFDINISEISIDDLRNMTLEMEGLYKVVNHAI